MRPKLKTIARIRAFANKPKSERKGKSISGVKKRVLGYVIENNQHKYHNDRKISISKLCDDFLNNKINLDDAIKKANEQTDKLDKISSSFKCKMKFGQSGKKHNMRKKTKRQIRNQRGMSVVTNISDKYLGNQKTPKKSKSFLKTFRKSLMR